MSERTPIITIRPHELTPEKPKVKEVSQSKRKLDSSDSKSIIARAISEKILYEQLKNID